MSQSIKGEIGQAIIRKDSLMFILIMGVWCSLVLYLNPKLLFYLKWKEPLWVTASILLFILSLNIFWLMMIHQIFVALFSKYKSKPFKGKREVLFEFPSVAILYATRNDYQKEAILSCLGQEYPNFHVYILDDSDDSTIKSELDSFLSKKENLTVLRRESHRGFKAGNLNHCLEKIKGQFNYFVVSDADGILPNDFIRKLLPYFLEDDRLAFVQACQKWNDSQENVFSRCLPYQVDLHNEYFIPSKNDFGFVMFYGHGALIRIDVWEEIGGFPESITEDLAFSSEVRKRGYLGYYESDVVCYEDFPQDYQTYLKRGQRWIQGTTEYFFKGYISLLFSKKVPWFEKLDIALSASRLLSSGVFLLLLLLLLFIIPLGKKYTSLYFPVFEPLEVLAKSSSFDGSGQAISWLHWNLLIYLISISYGFSELLGAILKWYNRPIKMLSYFSDYTFISLASLVFFSSKVLISPFRKLKDFQVSQDRIRLSQNRFLSYSNISFFLFELLMVSVLTYCVFQMSFYWLIPLISALVLNFFVYPFKWEQPGVHIAVTIPFLISLFVIVYMGLSFI